MRAVTNPIVIRMAVVFVTAIFAFLVGLLAMKRLRRKLQEETKLGQGSAASESFPLHTYHAVIQQLKQQKHELHSLQQAERRRARATENISAAVLSNLSCGVLFFNNSGLVRQGNSAAKSILGFASVVGMSATDLFRDARVTSSDGAGNNRMSLAQAVTNALQRAAALQGAEAGYATPFGQKRVLEITVSPVYSASAELMGAACLINDRSELSEIRRTIERRDEMSAEMAMQLRSSLLTISDCAKRLVGNHDPVMTEQLTADIRHEAEYLGKTIGSFLAKEKLAQGALASS